MTYYQRLLVFLAVSLSFYFADSAWAQPAREAIIRGKDATALVVLPSGRGFGSAFCIDSSGLFITNDHVVADSKNAEIKLVIRSGEEDQKEILTTLVKTDKDLDTAVLKAKKAGPFRALKFGADKDLVETETIVAFGYPFGTALATSQKKYPSISVNVGRVTAIRKDKGALERIQVDAQLNPGNSGGPVINSDGEVIGVVSTGIVRSGVSFAVPVSKMRDWLAKPTVVFTPQEIAFAKRFDPIEFPVEIAAIGRKPSDFSVQLTLGDDKRSVTARHVSAGRFLASIAPLANSGERQSVQLTVKFSRGHLQGYAQDTDIRFGDKLFKLSLVRSVRRAADEWTILGIDGKETQVGESPSGTIQVDLGDDVILPIDLAGFQELAAKAPTPGARIPYRLATTHDGKVVDERTGFITVRGGSGSEAVASRPSGLPMAEPTDITEPVVIDFAAPYDAFVLGGSGRYLVFLVRSEKKVIVVDVVKGEVKKVLTAPTEGDLIAAGRDDLFIFSPSKMMMQRYSLATLEREKIAQLSIAEAPKKMLLGASSKGPLLLVNKSATLVDAESLKPRKYEGNLIGGRDRSGYLFSTSHQGQTFVGVPWGSSPTKYETMRLHGNQIIVGSFGEVSGIPRWITPSADGELLFANGGIFTKYGRKVEASGIPGAQFPTVDPRYFLGVNFQENKTVFAVCTAADCRKVWHQQGGFPELVPRRISSWHDTIEALHAGNGAWRVQYVPWANVVATMPKGNKQVLLRKFDLLEILNGEGLPYLFVESTPPGEAASGRLLEYQIEAKSKIGGLTFKLEDGPDGCTVSPEGRLTWDVPADGPGGFSRIIVSVRDREGNEIFHAFEVGVHQPAKLFRIR